MVISVNDSLERMQVPLIYIVKVYFARIVTNSQNISSVAESCSTWRAICLKGLGNLLCCEVPQEELLCLIECYHLIAMDYHLNR